MQVSGQIAAPPLQDGNDLEKSGQATSNGRGEGIRDVLSAMRANDRCGQDCLRFHGSGVVRAEYQYAPLITAQDPG